jgi:hypothetical protein
MSFSSFFAAFGGTLGGMLGGGIFSTIGRFAGRMLGQYFDASSHTPDENYYYKKQLEMLFLDLDTCAKPIPLIFGKAKSRGLVIWSEPLREVENASSSARYFNDGSTKSVDHIVSYTYFATFAVAICQGQIDEIEKVWADDMLINLSNYDYKLYMGSQTQGPDPIIAKHYGDKTCAFRDLAYIVFKDLPLYDFGNKMPQFSFEVTRKADSQVQTVEDLVKSMVMIPGSGEFVYDTMVQYKIYKNSQGTELSKEVINSHNHKGIANSLYSLDQLMLTCSNLESIAVVVCWFGDSLDIADCNILPAVEYKDQYTCTSCDWVVAGFNRSSAKLIGRSDMHPRYGGSVNDSSLIRYLQELKKRGLKVMLYPMFFIDLPGKPWRGHLTGLAKDVANFFNKEHGYNNFILHYANLSKDLVDAFVIGSELKQITSIRTKDNKFPAVNELVRLAEMTKRIVGSRVKITYAADWSEYHHTSGGWFNLDELWASPALDFVGIDAYVPLTSSINSQISDQEILQGWSSGEGFDYFVDSNGVKKNLAPQYAWKNFHHWWSNFHTNPDGTQTPWRPCMKKICFTEFGFPSIDKATNQPNVFYDPNCVDGKAPIYSNGTTDFSLQRRAIKLSIQYWQNNSMLEGMYLWTWDARPYPIWPHYDVWNDGYLWEKGHWVNSKFGIISLSSVVAEICNNAGVDLEEIDVSNLDAPIEGIIFEKNLSSLDAINLLRCCYFFDIYQDKDRLIFKKRGTGHIHSIDRSDLLKIDKVRHFEFTQATEQQVPNQVHISFINQNKKYRLDHSCVNVDVKSNKGAYFLYLPIVLSEAEATRIAHMVINNARSENKMLTFMLPITYLHLCPCDVITINISNHRYDLRIIDIQVTQLTLKITALSEDISIYSSPLDNNAKLLLQYKSDSEELRCLDLPILPWLFGYKRYVHIAHYGNLATYLYASLDNKNFDKVCKITNSSILGTLVSFYSVLGANSYVIDNISYFIIHSTCKLRNLNDDEFWSNKSFIMIGDEVLRYKSCELIADNTYKISQLIRGELATEEHINTHINGQFFAVIGQNISNIPVDKTIINRDLFFKAGIKSFSYKIKDKTLPTPINLTHCLKDNSLKLWWTGRAIALDDWIEQDIDLIYQITVISLQEEISLNTSKSYIDILLPKDFSPPIKVKVQSIFHNYNSASSVLQIL